MNKLFYILLLLITVSCQKAIEFDLPDTNSTLVIEAIVENDSFPKVFLTRSQGYFDPLNPSTVGDMFILDASEVILNDGTNDYNLSLDIDFSYFDSIPVPVYTNNDINIIGEFGKNYTLKVFYKGDTLTARAKIPQPIYMDSLWFEAYEALDSLGFIWANFEDADTFGNCYRWFAQRINSYTYNYDPPFDNVKGTMKDRRPLAPIGSSTDDKLFNGLKFDFAFPRGEDGAAEGPDDEGDEEAFFKRGDTVVVKNTTTTYPIYLYVRAMENAAVSNGSIFSSPGNLPYNVEGDGIGIFYGYGSTYDTLICE
tara:strand:- start:70 stop:999 length:930 start_codon:yes stop_codon:yes gene_type:complete